MAKEGESQLLLDRALMGVVGGFAAVFFPWMLRISGKFFLGWVADYQAPKLPGEGGTLEQVIGPQGLWLVVPVVVASGLISRFLVYTWAPETEGHGTDTAVKAFHRAEGFIRARVAPLKMIASAITIGSGGSAGRESPTALIGAGFGSVYATLQHRSEKERRLLVIIGMGAARVPIATLVMVMEMTGGYRLLADSPAHYVEYLRVGLNLLGKRKVLATAHVGHLNLMSLLRSGIPVELPGGKQIMACGSGTDTSYFNKPIKQCTDEAGEDNVEIVVVMRDQDLLLPNPESVFKPDDQMLAIVTPRGRVWLKQHLVMLQPEEKSRGKG